MNSLFVSFLYKEPKEALCRGGNQW